MGTVELQGDSPFVASATQSGRAHVSGAGVRLVLNVLYKGELVQVQTEMLPKVALDIAGLLAQAASNAVI